MLLLNTSVCLQSSSFVRGLRVKVTTHSYKCACTCWNSTFTLLREDRKASTPFKYVACSGNWVKYCRPLTTFVVGSRLCDFCKKAVKVVRRHLWSKCSHLIADRLTPLDLQVWQDISNWYCSVILLYTFPIILLLHRPHVPTYCSYCVALVPKVS